MLLGEEHDRGSFTCGVESLDRYLKIQAGQDVRRKANAVFILSEICEPTHVLGYYTLCAMAISQGNVPEAARKHVPRYLLVSADADRSPDRREGTSGTAARGSAAGGCVAARVR